MRGAIKMVDNLYKSKVSKLIEKAQKKGMIKKYSDFCETEKGKKMALSKDEIIYYTSVNKGETK